MLHALGHRQIALLDGGFVRWEAEGLPVSTETPTFPVTDYKAQPNLRLYADVDDVRPGRIPGSVNVPAGDLVDSETYIYQPIEAIRQTFEEAGLSASKRAITYCAGGVAASAGAFALEMLGHKDWALYDNSLLEWSTKPELPMEMDD